MIKTLGKPSSLIHEICIEKIGDWNLFKFSESLQRRMKHLLDKKKADQLTPEETADLDAIGELDRNLYSCQRDGDCSKCQSVMQSGKLYKINSSRSQWSNLPNPLDV